MKIIMLLLLAIILPACGRAEFMNDSHYIWLWDSDTMQFIRNEELELISWGGSISLSDEGYSVYSDIHENAARTIILLDVDFDGVADILVFRGHEGNQGVVTYSAFLKRGDTYIQTNFDEIPFPAIDVEGHRIRGTIRNWAVSNSWFLYEFIDDRFVMVDSFTREVCRETFELMYIVNLRDGYLANDVYFYINNQEEIYELFYASESKFGLGSDRWQSIFDLH